eukprot:gene4415-5172_t
MKLISSIVLALLAITTCCQLVIAEDRKPFKMAVITTGHLNDFGFNTMINEARIGVQSVLNTTNVDILIVNEHQLSDKIDELVAHNYTSIIAGSLEYTKIANASSIKYPNVTFLARGSNKNSTNLSFITYNIGICHYMIGFFAGLVTKTNKLGFVGPGFPLYRNYNANAYFVGARNSNPDITVDYYSTGAWITPDVSSGAANSLLDMGVDLISHTQDDYTVPLASINRGFMALGTNGFPTGRIYGENIGVSFVANWTDTYIKFAKQYMDDVGFSFKENNGFPEGMLSLDFAHGVAPEVKDKMNAELDRLSKIPVKDHPYYCNPYNKFIYNDTIVDDKGCMASRYFFLLDNDPYPGMTYHGQYEVPIVKVPMKKAIETGFIVVASIFAGISLLMAGAVWYFKNTHSIRSASPVFCIAIIGGGILTYLGVIIWVIPMTTGSCVAKYWLLAIGYALLIGSLVVKNFRIWIIFDNPELKSVKITNPQLFPYVGAIITVLVILLAVMSSSTGGLGVTTEHNIDDLGPYEEMDVCGCNSTGNRVLYGLLGVFGALLLTGVFVSWKIRIVDIDEFNESKPIANVLYAVFFCVFVIVSLMASPQSQESQTIIICASVLFITTSALAILFVPKFWRIHLFGDKSSSDMFNRNTRSTVAEARSSATKAVSGSLNDEDTESDSSLSEKPPRVRTTPPTPTSATVIESGLVIVSQEALEAMNDGVVHHATFDSDSDSDSVSDTDSQHSSPCDV